MRREDSTPVAFFFLFSLFFSLHSLSSLSLFSLSFSSVDLHGRVDRPHKPQARPQPHAARQAEHGEAHAGHISKIEQRRDEGRDLEAREEVEGRVGEGVEGDAAAVEEGAPPPPGVFWGWSFFIVVGGGRAGVRKKKEEEECKESVEKRKKKKNSYL